MVDVDKLRNVVILSHGGAGKTSLCEALLYNTKGTTRIGRVEDGNTVSDYEAEEAKRGGSIQTSLIPCHWNGHKLNLLDTPGYDDFVGEVMSALRVADGAIIVVAATSGVEVGTVRSWDRCEEKSIPRIIFINKMDRENADFYRSLEEIQAQFGKKCVPFVLPVGAQQSFKEVVDLVEAPQEISAELADQVSSARERLIEAVAETDDELVAKYLEGEELTSEEIITGVKKAILSGQIVPVMAGSATLNLGVQELLERAVGYLPSPAESHPVQAIHPSTKDNIDVVPDPKAHLAAFVFKTTADPFVGKLSLFRVFSGTLHSNSEVWNQARDQAERIGQVYVLKGKSQEQVQEIGPGDIGAVSKLTATLTSDTLCQKDHPFTFSPMVFPVGYYSVSVSPKTKADVDKMTTSLARMVEEDPSLRVSKVAATGEFLLSGLGGVHVETAIERVHRKFGVGLELRLPKVPYRETITAVTQAEYKHKKQSGGHGQYGHVRLRLEPKERGEGFEFGEEIKGGAVPKEYIPPTEKGILKALHEGTLAGYPVVDLKAILYDGSFHDVDSSGICFEIAGAYALRKGVAEASPILLEPIMKLAVTVPNSFSGDVIGDLNGKRGKIMGMIPTNGTSTIEAEVPQSELLRYATELRSLTQGQGSYTMQFSHYEGAPPQITQRVAEEAKRAKEAERA